MAALTISEQLLLARWKSIDFTGWNEAEVREGFIVDLLHTLGYRKGTSYDLEMEKPLQLAKPFHRIGRKKVDIDYAPSIRKRYFWIVEAKPGKPKDMKVGDLLQVHLYAVHPEVQARLVVLINGWQVRVYDALTMSSFEDALLVVDQSDDGSGLLELREMLGATNMLVFQRKRMLDIVRTTLASEVDVAVADSLAAEVAVLAKDARKVVEKNADDLWKSSMALFFKDEAADLENMSLEELFVTMDLPEHGRPVIGREFVRRVERAASAERAELVQKLVKRTKTRPHAIFRVTALRCLIDMLELGLAIPSSPVVTSLAVAINDLALANIDYWAFNGLANALCHLDNVATRVAMKACLKLGQPFLQEVLQLWRDSMTAAERVKQRPSLDTLVTGTCAHLQEVLWRWYASASSADTVWGGIWNLHAIEAVLDALPPIATGAESPDFYGLSFLGLSHDHLRNGTWNVTQRRTTTLANAGVDRRVLAFARLTHEEVRIALPPEKRAPTGFTATKTADDITAALTKALALRVVRTVGRQMQSGADEPRREP